MSDLTPIRITPITIGLDFPQFEEICAWPFADSYVRRLLREDIPQRVQRGTCRIWVYVDPDGQLVGFGTIDVRDDYSDYTDGRLHPYVPLLAVNPAMEGRGHGKSIVQHLIDHAALLASGPGECHPVLFLDVYEDNTRAIGLYTKCGFVIIEDQARPDPDEAGRLYLIMAMRVSAMPSGGPD